MSVGELAAIVPPMKFVPAPGMKLGKASRFDRHLLSIPTFGAPPVGDANEETRI